MYSVPSCSIRRVPVSPGSLVWLRRHECQRQRGEQLRRTEGASKHGRIFSPGTHFLLLQEEKAKSEQTITDLITDLCPLYLLRVKAPRVLDSTQPFQHNL